MTHEFIEVDQVPERVGSKRGPRKLQGKHQELFAEAIAKRKAIKFPNNAGQVLHVCSRLYAETLGLTPNCRTVGGDTYVWFTG